MVQIPGDCSLQWAGLRGHTVILMSPMHLVLLPSALTVEENFCGGLPTVDGDC